MKMVFVEGNIVKAVIKASAIKMTRGKGKKKKKWWKHWEGEMECEVK